MFIEEIGNTSDKQGGEGGKIRMKLPERETVFLRHMLRKVNMSCQCYIYS